MKIISVEPIVGVRITTDETDYNEYTRYCSDCWYVRMGESVEPVYECTRLESMYQKYIGN